MAVSSSVGPSPCVGGWCCHGVKDRGRAAMCGDVGSGRVLVLGVVMLGGREGKNGRFWTTRQE